MEIRTPEYTATLVPHMHGVAHEGVQTGLTILHTPGHTPDELAIWDSKDGVLYVGDTLYEWAAIIFPSEGNLVDWWKSVEDLIEVVKLYNASLTAQQAGKKARICAGHVNYGKEDALEVLTASQAYVWDVLKGQEKAYKEEERRGEKFLWHRREDSRYALGIPERLLEEARKKLNI
jgi:glyoxylase-like metal-dependent hydrolase (beta-lactamase superfamily II)